MTKLELAKAFIANIEEPKTEDGCRYLPSYADGSVTYERYKRQLMEARALLMDVLREVQ